MSQGIEQEMSEEVDPPASPKHEDNTRNFVVNSYKYLKEDKEQQMIKYKYIAQVGNGCYIEFDPFPFDAGSVQLAFHGELIKASGNGDLLERTGRYFVVKVPQRIEGMENIDTIDRYTYLRSTAEKAMSRQAIVKSFVSEFNRLKVSKKIRINECETAQIVREPNIPEESHHEKSLVALRNKLYLSEILYDKSYVTVEAFIEGKFEKFINNDGKNYSRKANLPGAFAHWTWERSRGSRMVCDIQGVRRISEYVLTDPCVHSRKRVKDEARYGQTDLGKFGMIQFFQKHECNNLCKDLGLQDMKEPTSKLFDTAKMLTRTKDHAFIADMRFDITQEIKEKDTQDKTVCSNTEHFVSLKSVLAIEKHEADLLAKSKESSKENTPKLCGKSGKNFEASQDTIAATAFNIEKTSLGKQFRTDVAPEVDHEAQEENAAEVLDIAEKQNEICSNDSTNDLTTKEDLEDRPSLLPGNEVGMSSERAEHGISENNSSEEKVIIQEGKALDCLLDDSLEEESIKNNSQVEDTRIDRSCCATKIDLDEDSDTSRGLVLEDRKDSKQEQKTTENEDKSSISTCSELNTHASNQENDKNASGNGKHDNEICTVASDTNQTIAEEKKSDDTGLNNSSHNDNALEEKSTEVVHGSNIEKNNRTKDVQFSSSDPIEIIRETLTDLLKVASVADELKLMLENSISQHQSLSQENDAHEVSEQAEKAPENEAYEMSKQAENSGSRDVKENKQSSSDNEKCSKLQEKDECVDLNTEESKVDDMKSDFDSYSGKTSEPKPRDTEQSSEVEGEEIEAEQHSIEICSIGEQNKREAKVNPLDFSESSTASEERAYIKEKMKEHGKENIKQVFISTTKGSEEAIQENQDCELKSSSTKTSDTRTNIELEISEKCSKVGSCTENESLVEKDAETNPDGNKSTEVEEKVSVAELEKKNENDTQEQNDFMLKNSDCDLEEVGENEILEEDHENNTSQECTMPSSESDDANNEREERKPSLSKRDKKDENLASLAEALNIEKPNEINGEELSVSASNTCNCRAEKNSDAENSKKKHVQSFGDGNQEQDETVKHSSETEVEKRTQQIAEQGLRSIEKDISHVSIALSVDCTVQKTEKQEEILSQECITRDGANVDVESNEVNVSRDTQNYSKKSECSILEDGNSSVTKLSYSDKDIERPSSPVLKELEGDEFCFPKLVLSVLKRNGHIDVPSSDLGFRARAAEQYPFSGYGEFAIALNEQSRNVMDSAEHVKQKICDQIMVSERFIFVGNDNNADSHSNLKKWATEKICNSSKLGSFSEFVELNSLADAFKVKIIVYSAVLLEKKLEIQVENKTEFVPCCSLPDLRMVNLAKLNYNGTNLFVALSTCTEVTEEV